MPQIETLFSTFIVSTILVMAVLVVLILYTYTRLNGLLWRVKRLHGEWKAAQLRSSQVRGYTALGVGASSAHELSVMRAAAGKGRGGGKFFKATVESYPTARAVDVAGDSIRTNTSSADLEMSLLRAYLEAAEAYNSARTDLPECIGVRFLGNRFFPYWNARVPFPNNGRHHNRGKAHGQRGGKFLPRRRGGPRGR